MKKVCVCFLAVVLAVAFTAVVSAADKAPSDSKARQGMPMAGQQSMGTKGAMRPNFNMMMGTVSKIDMTDPANVKIEVKDEKDNQVHTVEVTSATNVTKSTEISELKVGDTVRVMARKIDDKEVAMGVMFGKFKKITPPRLPSAPGQAGTQAIPPIVKEETKK